MVFYHKKEHNTETYCKICKILYSRYVPIKLLIAKNFGYCLPTMLTLFVIYLDRKFTDFYSECRYFPLFSKYSAILQTK